MNILFILDPYEKLTLEEDTTIAVMAECTRRKHSIWACHSDELEVHNGVPLVFARKTEIGKSSEPNSTIQWREQETSQHNLSDFNVIFMRKDPPFNQEYLTATYVLSLVDTSHTYIVNDPKALRNYNEKLIIFEFPGIYPPTIVTQKKETIKNFVDEHKIAVIKPLYEYGGHGIAVLNRDDKNSNSIIELVSQRGAQSVMVQKYLPEAADGDIRVLILNGKIIGMQNRLASPRDYRNNRSSGGTLAQATLSKKQLDICQKVAMKLPAMGIYFAGLDLIGNFITEINITSPTGLVWMNKLDNVVLERLVVDFLETYAEYTTSKNS